VNLPFNIDSALQNISKVRLPGGVVGKVTVAVIIASLCMALIAWSVQNVWLSGGALVAVFVLAFTMLWRVINFADRHPQAALLEGAEFLVHEQLLQASKGHPSLTFDVTDRTQPVPVEGPAANPQIALTPDEAEPAQLSNSEGGRQ
jgi:hypothetical protein